MHVREEDLEQYAIGKLPSLTCGILNCTCWSAIRARTGWRAEMHAFVAAMRAACNEANAEKPEVLTVMQSLIDPDRLREV
jgi:hypothetical protein